MKQAQLSIELSNLTSDINQLVLDAKDRLVNTMDHTSTSNEQVSNDIDMFNTLTDHLIATRISSDWKKRYDHSKQTLDDVAMVKNFDPRPRPEITIDVFNMNNLHFRKKMNKMGVSTLLTDFINALQQLGVDGKVIDDAKKKAEKPKKGS